MVRPTALLMAMALVACVSLAAAAENPGIYTCSLCRSFQCTPDDGCEESSLSSMSLPRFARIDLKEKTITSLDKNVPRNATRISLIEKVDGLIVLHGSELRGWTITIAEDSGVLSLTAAGEGEVITVFGSCIAP